MKRSLMAAAAAVLLSNTAAAQVPEFVPVQGYLTDAEGQPLEGPVTVAFGLYAEPAGGEAAWAETQEVLVEDGFFTAYLGQNAPLDLGILADGGARFLGIAVADDAEMAPRIPLGAAPFAAVAGRAAEADHVPGLADVAWSGAWDDLSGRPELAPVATSGRFADLVDVPAGFDDGDDVLTEAEVDAFVANDGYALKSSLHPVASSGLYADLTGAPQLAAVATTGAFSDLTGVPAEWADGDDVLTEAQVDAMVANDGYAHADQLSALEGRLAPVATTGAYSDLVGTPVLAPVATTGAYSDLAGTPVLAPVATTGAYGDLTGTPALASVATTGAYADLTGTPALASVATTGAFADLAGVPAELADGDDVLSEAQVDAFVADNGYAAAADVTALQGSLARIATTGAWSDLGKVPVPVQQLGGLTCKTGDVVEAGASGALACGTDDVLDPTTLIQNQSTEVQAAGFRIDGTGEMGEAVVAGALSVGGGATVAGAAAVGGTVTAADFERASAETRSYLVSPFDCLASPGQDDEIRWNSDYAYAWVAAGTLPYEAVMECPVHLPHGATMTRFVCQFSDADAAGMVEAELRQRPFGTFGAAARIARAFTSVTFSGGVSMTEAPMFPTPVDDATHYFVTVHLRPGMLVPNVTFSGCRIEYETTEP